MPEVWTHNNLSRHFMPRSNTVFLLFILLCSIVSFVFLFNQQCEITDFLEDQQISLKKTDIKQTTQPIVQKCKCKYILWIEKNNQKNLCKLKYTIIFANKVS